MIRDQLREAYRANAEEHKVCHPYGSTVAFEFLEEPPLYLTIDPVEDTTIPINPEVEGYYYTLQSYSSEGYKAVYKLDTE